MEDLISLMDAIDACSVCSSMGSCRKLPSKGHGNISARLMMVNGCPDEKSILSKRYWSNPAGEKLRGVFSEINLVPEEVCYITDAVKCLPLEEETPLDEERANCRQYLHYEINLLLPNYIVTVGEIATQAVFEIFGMDFTNILKLHNENGIDVKSGYGMKVFPIQHPSHVPKFMDYVLYRYQLKDVFMKSANRE